MIVSYKDREEDRRRGLEAGADYYLTKGSFHDETLLQAVVDLIGGAATHEDRHRQRHADRGRRRCAASLSLRARAPGGLDRARRRRGGRRCARRTRPTWS